MYLPFYFILILFGVPKLTLCKEGPVIGILAQESFWSGLKHCMPSNSTFIAASYVKAIEASGGRVIPIFTNRTIEYYIEEIMKVNGILIPGGGCSFKFDSGIGRSTFIIFEIAKRLNNIKDYFPILGICLGFELLLMASISGKFPFAKCHAQNINLPLELIPEMEEKSSLFSMMPKDVQQILLTEPVTSNHHSKCITLKNFTSMHLDRFWNPITVNKLNGNFTFISTIEAKKYPFVGLQFHPEKNAYEFSEKDPHSWPAIYSARYFFDWFVNKCRQNKHKYLGNSTLENEIIYNYPITYIGKINSVYQQVYLFQ